MNTIVRRTLTVLGCLVGGVLALVVFAGLALRHPMPSGKAGPEADALARAIETAVNKDAWDQTKALRWGFGGSRGLHYHLWDRERQLSRVRFGDIEVLQNLSTGKGKAFRGGVEVTGEEGAKLVKKAYSYFINDSFWLNPLAKLFDDGVTRLLAQAEDGSPSLIIRYSSGGLTPGDSYQWLLSAEKVPRAWRLWVSIFPIPGVEASWAEWKRLGTGALVSTQHKLAVITIRVVDPAGAKALSELEPGPDPFARLQ